MMNGLTRRRQDDDHDKSDLGGGGGDNESSSVGIHYGDEEESHVRRRRRPGGFCCCERIMSSCQCHNSCCCMQRVVVPIAAQIMSRQREQQGEGSWSSIPKGCCERMMIKQSQLVNRYWIGDPAAYRPRWQSSHTNRSEQTTTGVSSDRSDEKVPLKTTETDVEAPKQQQIACCETTACILDEAEQCTPLPKAFRHKQETHQALPTSENSYDHSTAPLLSIPGTHKSSEAVTPKNSILVNENSDRPSAKNQAEPYAVSLLDYMECRVGALPSKPELEVKFSRPTSLEQLEMDALLVDDDYRFHDDMADHEEKVIFSLRLPNAASLQQLKIDQIQRAERTHDFMETAKSLHLHLDRDKWTAKRNRRGSMMSASSYTSSIDTSYDASMSTPGHERHSSQGSRPISRPPLSRTNSVTSLHELLQQESMALRASPSRHLDGSQALACHDTLQQFELPLRDDDKEETNTASLINSFGKVSSISQESEVTEEACVSQQHHRGRRVPRRNSFLAGSKIERFDSVSNSSGNGSGQVRYTPHSPRRRSFLSETQYSGASSRRSSLSNGQQEKQVGSRDIQQQRLELGYEDMEVPMKSSSFDTDVIGSRRSSGSGGGSQLDDSYRRSRNRRAPRRSSFVAGSKIELHSSSGSARTGRRRVEGRRTSN